MDKQSAIRLLDETFNTDFDLNRYIKFVKELFNNFYVNQKDCTKYIANEYKDYISSFVKIGDYENSKKSIEILVVQLNKTSSRDRARTMQRNFIANWLGKTGKDAALVAFYGDDPQDWRFSFVKMEYRLAEVEPGKVKAVKELTPAKRYSFLVGVNEPNHTCRRQFLEVVQQEDINPSIDEIEKAFSIDNVTKEFFTEYKELFLELNESLQEVIKKDPYVKLEFEERNISTVDFAKKLLGQIVFIYFLQKKGWLGVSKDDEGQFKKWGTGPKNFLRRLFDKEIVSYDNFFNEVLEPLFYEALADDRTANHDYYSRFKCKIPFLNGGLFEPINEYNWAGTEIVLDNSVFRKIFGTFDRFNFTVKEDEPLEKEVAVDPEMLGKVFENLLGVKDRKSIGAYYTPREIVHYMCQQSLINYIETNTSIPRKDIEKFIQEGDSSIDTSIRTKLMIKKLESQLRKGVISPIEFEKKIKEELDNLKLPKSIIKDYKSVDNFLKNIKVVDPAVGSGAFPIGMMNEIIKARSILSIYFKEERKDYDLKREVIENSLYGVDIEPSAVEITKLRFWLSLIVDELDMQNIKPLPNLDHKIMCGNSLLEEFEGVKLFDEKLLGEVKRDFSHEMEQIDKEIGKLNKEKGDIALGKKENDGRSKAIEREIKKLEKKKHELQFGPKEKIKDKPILDALQHRIKESQKKLNELNKLQKQYFNEQNRNKKKQLREDIDKIEWELIEETLKEQGNESAMEKLAQYKKNKSKPFFLWKLYFAEVFQRENPGFDIVIGNPPYQRIQGINKSLVELYNKVFVTATGKYDLYVIFTEKGTRLLNRNGTLNFIMPHKWINSGFGKGLRKFVKDKISKIISFKDYQVFNATTYTSLIWIQSESKYLQFVEIDDNLETNTKLQLFLHSLSPKYFNTISTDKLDEKPWSLTSNVIEKVLEKINSNSEPVKTVLEGIFQGIVTTGDDIFYIEGKYQGNLFIGLSKRKKTEIVLEKEIVKPLLMGSDVKRFTMPQNKQYVIYPHSSKNGKTEPIEENDLRCIYPHTYKYLSEFRTELVKKKIKYKTNPKYWYSLHRAREQFVFEKEKIITPYLSIKGNMTLDRNRFYTNAKCYNLIKKKDSLIDLKFLLAVLNSSILWFFLKNTAAVFRGGYFAFTSDYLENFPIKEISSEKQKPFINLVNQILSITKDDDYLDNPDKQAKVKRLEKEIDAQVYKLYDLTPEEIKIVEGFNEGE